MSKLLTLIIPVYNGETYLRRCLDSILVQTDINLADMEVLLLDDGSSDGSVAILHEYQTTYPGTFVVSSHANKGVAKTRNEGIEKATGTYVLFIDQDDWIDSDYCATLYREIERHQLDVVFSGMRRPDENGRIITQDKYRKDHYFNRYMSMSAWAKIHRTSFLRESDIKLFNNHHGEDIVFSFEETQKTSKIKGIPYCGYNWFFNSMSVSNTTQRGLTAVNVASILRTQQRLIDLNTSMSRYNEFYITLMTAYYLFFAGRKSTVDEFMTGTNILMNNLRQHYPRYARNRYIWLSPLGTIPLFAIGVKVFVVLYKGKLLRFYGKIYCKGIKV